MKSSQVSGYVFIYILTAVLVSVIFIYGYRAVVSFRERSEEISYLKFQNEINRQIKSVYFDVGSVKIREFALPSKFKNVCFIDNFDNNNMFETSIDPVISDDRDSNTLNNVYLIEDIATRKFITDEKIEINKQSNTPGGEVYDNLCIPAINGKISLRLTGKGDHALIEEYNKP